MRGEKHIFQKLPIKRGEKGIFGGDQHGRVIGGSQELKVNLPEHDDQKEH